MRLGTEDSASVTAEVNDVGHIASRECGATKSAAVLHALLARL